MNGRNGEISQSIDMNDEAYPEILKGIKDPPKELYCSGDLSLLHMTCVAVVGSRKYTENGRKVAYETAKALACSGACVVSGLARGIDTFAHEGALAAGGKTIAVLGTGIDVCYPAANRKLKEEIRESGLIISEYPSGYPASKGTFPRRNRIISGLSEAVVIAEAGLNSGSLITAGLAEEQGRSVYAVPSGIFNGCALGSNMLIRDGAMPLVVIDDLIHDLGLKRERNEEVMPELGDDEKRVYEVLLTRGEMSTDDVARATGFAPSKVRGIVTVMEIKGVVWTALGKIFLAK